MLLLIWMLGLPGTLRMRLFSSPIFFSPFPYLSSFLASSKSRRLFSKAASVAGLRRNSKAAPSIRPSVVEQPAMNDIERDHCNKRLPRLRFQKVFAGIEWSNEPWRVSQQRDSTGARCTCNASFSESQPETLFRPANRIANFSETFVKHKAPLPFILLGDRILKVYKAAECWAEFPSNSWQAFPRFS